MGAHDIVHFIMKHKITILLAAIILALTAACSSEEEVLPLKVGMMPAVDAAPFYYALEEGFFADEEVPVELVLFTNAQNRQSALQTGEIDGAMTDLVALTTSRAGDFPLTGVLSTDGLFPLLSRIDLAETSEVTAGIMEISVTNYLLDQYLADSHEIRKVYINEIPARLEAVDSGQLDLGVFPEPFASIGELRGLEKIVFPGIPEESVNIIAFSESALTEKYEAVSRFTAAYRRAVLEMDEDSARRVLLESLPNLPDEIRPLIRLPEYHSPRLPGREFLEELVRWSESVTGSTYAMTGEDLVDRSFVETP